MILKNHLNSATPSLCSVVFMLAWFAIAPLLRAVVPAPDGGYPGFNTAEGQNALKNLTTGVGNTAVGWSSLFTNSTSSYNTGIGAGALALNTADENTATGSDALLLNTTGTENTANGAFALLSNTIGNANTAIGAAALQNNTTGHGNAASGKEALHDNTEGFNNTATGPVALLSNTTGNYNTATGYGALVENETGASNTVIGRNALYSNTGNGNTAIGALAGSHLTTGSGNVCIGESVEGVAGESGVTRIRNIGSTPIIDGTSVVIGSTGGIGAGILGYPASSRRYKEDIKPMDKASETLFALKPVTFRAKDNMSPTRVKHYGLIAEDVAAVDSDLVVYNQKGKPETLRFDSINAMLLNEFLKAHKVVEKQQATIAQLKKEMQTMVARLNEHVSKLQSVSDQVQMNSPESPLVVSDP